MKVCLEQSDPQKSNVSFVVTWNDIPLEGYVLRDHIAIIKEKCEVHETGLKGRVVTTKGPLNICKWEYSKLNSLNS